MGTKQVTHTPGPWHWTEWGVKEKVFKVWKDGANIADVCMLPEANQFEELPNARLIAAAPDLLSELKTAERTLRWAAQESHRRVKAEIVGGWIHHADLIRAAIAKAEGVSNATP